MRYSRTAVAGVVLLLMGAAALVWLRSGGPWKRDFDAGGVLREVTMLKELVTVRYSIQKVAALTEPKQLFGSESILLIVQAKVLGGVDLVEISESDVRVKDRQTVMIRLPQARILHVYLDENQTKVWDRQKTWWTPWVPYDKDLEQKARVAALDSVKQEALDMGILKDARVSAETLIRGLLHPLGFETVEFPRPAT